LTIETETATDDMIQAFPIVSGDNAFADQTDTCTHKPLKILHTDTVDLLGIKIEFCKKITEPRFLIVKDREKGIDTCYLGFETPKLISTERASAESEVANIVILTQGHSPSSICFAAVYW